MHCSFVGGLCGAVENVVFACIVCISSLSVGSCALTIFCSGTYCPANSTVNGILCQAGYICGGGAAPPAAVLAGTYSLAGMAVALPCASSIGWYCPPGCPIATGVVCAGGYTCAGLGNPPVLCVAGNSCSGGVSAPCTAGLAGTYCPPGSIVVGTPCPVGFYCTGGTSAAVLCTGLPGTHCPPGTSVNGVICSAGSYCLGGALASITCPAGFFCGAGRLVQSVPRSQFHVFHVIAVFDCRYKYTCIFYFCIC